MAGQKTRRKDSSEMAGAARRRARPAMAPPAGGLVDELQQAVARFIEDQKEQLACAVKGSAAALHEAAKTLQREPGGTVARYAEEAATRVEAVADTLHRETWRELLDDVDGLARQRPALFLLGTLATGFVLGRVLSSAVARDDESPDEAVSGEAMPSASTNKP